MQRDYRLAAYAIALSALLLVGSAAAIVAGSSIGDTANDSQPAETGPDRMTNTVTVADSQEFDVATATNDSNSLTISQGARTCSGALRIDDPDRIRTDVQVDDVTVTLVEHHDGEPFDEIEREQFAETVWSEVSGYAALDKYDHVEIKVNQYYETVEREEPLDTVGIRVHPVDNCLPTVKGEVSLENRSVDVRSSHSELEDLNLNITDTIGILNDDERKLVSQLIESNEHTSYNIQSEFDDPSTLEATVLEATNDGQVKLELTEPESEGRAIIVTIDLESETVERTWTKVSIVGVDDTDAVAIEDSGNNETFTFEVNSTKEET